MSLRVHLQLLTPDWHNLSMFRGRTTCVWLFVRTGQYLVQRKRNRELNRNRKRKRERNRQSTSIYATSAWVRVYVRSYVLSSPYVCLYTSWTYGVSFISQHKYPLEKELWINSFDLYQAFTVFMEECRWMISQFSILYLKLTMGIKPKTLGVKPKVSQTPNAGTHIGRFI